MTFKRILHSSTIALAVLLLANGSVYADKPEKADKESRKGNSHSKENKADRRDSSPGNVSLSFEFGSAETRIVRDYYGSQIAKGKCPPGLAKKGNGCQPPGQAKQWQKGRALGSDVRYYDIPNELRIRLPVPPLNHKYVQLGTDVLLIAVGTAIVVDAIDGIF